MGSPSSQVHKPPSEVMRAAAVVGVREWIGTPYHTGARVKGAGVDCATLIAEYLIECGVSKRENLGIYTQDWFCHTTEEIYMMRLMRHARKTLSGIARPGIGALPGTLALFRVVGSPVFNHGSVVTNWPLAVHAVHPKVEEADMTKHWLTAYREVEFFDPWGVDARE